MLFLFGNRNRLGDSRVKILLLLQGDTYVAAKLEYETARKKALFGGLIGLDRRYLGDNGMANGKLVLTICTLGLYCVPWWIIDYITITRHKDDWNQWIEKKQAKQAIKQRAIEAVAEQKALVEERKKTGKCVKCGSDRIQAVTETNSQAQLTDAFANILPHGNTHLEQKVRSKTFILCLNCGHKRAV